MGLGLGLGLGRDLRVRNRDSRAVGRMSASERWAVFREVICSRAIWSIAWEMIESTSFDDAIGEVWAE